MPEQEIPKLVPMDQLGPTQDKFIEDLSKAVKDGHAALVITFDGHTIRHGLISNKVANMALPAMVCMTESVISALVDAMLVANPGLNKPRVTLALFGGLMEMLVDLGLLPPLPPLPGEKPGVQ